MKNRTIDYILRATWQAVSRMYNEEAIKYDASMAIAFALLSIDREGISSTLLGPNMGMEATSLTRTLKKMETKGLILKEKNPNDGRGVIIKLTPLGLEKRELSKAKVKRFNEMIRANVSDEKIRHFIEVTDVINELINNKTIFEK
ncbi:MarR family winged helix-turn-helix transcriptional regulator [Myroides indicus]|uniref:DNA-binding MarR family transcriptional regulator n=1 Tax=Myroides indicus TaxID=1323422 RepID=A0A4V3E918_9FLAO|nr:MarR family transcriptional regulator [Myroides indicus]TDS64191.1 DNA-binding MarR family transcriptional regulator [Myroides indicus]